MKNQIHPTVDKATASEKSDFLGGILKCNCDGEKVTVRVSSQVAFNHACGCTKCWKPEGAVFSVVGVVSTDKLDVISHAEKLKVVDDTAAIRRYACVNCNVHMYGRIANPDHPFFGLDFIHTELSQEAGWERPKFAAFVSSIIESGIPPTDLDGIRSDLQSKGLSTYDCLSPPLMDLIATHTAKAKGTLRER